MSIRLADPEARRDFLLRPGSGTDSQDLLVRQFGRAMTDPIHHRSVPVPVLHVVIPSFPSEVIGRNASKVTPPAFMCGIKGFVWRRAVKFLADVSIRCRRARPLPAPARSSGHHPAVAVFALRKWPLNTFASLAWKVVNPFLDYSATAALGQHDQRVAVPKPSRMVHVAHATFGGGRIAITNAAFAGHGV